MGLGVVVRKQAWTLGLAASYACVLASTLGLATCCACALAWVLGLTTCYACTLASLGLRHAMACALACLGSDNGVLWQTYCSVKGKPCHGPWHACSLSLGLARYVLDSVMSCAMAQFELVRGGVQTWFEPSWSRVLIDSKSCGEVMEEEERNVVWLGEAWGRGKGDGKERGKVGFSIKNPSP